MIRLASTNHCSCSRQTDCLGIRRSTVLSCFFLIRSRVRRSCCRGQDNFVCRCCICRIYKSFCSCSDRLSVKFYSLSASFQKFQAKVHLSLRLRLMIAGGSDSTLQPICRRGCSAPDIAGTSVYAFHRGSVKTVSLRS